METSNQRLIEAIEEYENGKEDIHVSLSEVNYENDSLILGSMKIGVTPTAANQVCKCYGIPYGFFFNKMSGNERELVFNRLKENHSGETKVFRLNNNILYGVVSKRYQSIDNSVILETVQAADDLGISLRAVDFTLHPDHTKVKFVPSELYVGELAPMIEFTNSENGLGSFQVWAGVYRWICNNGMMISVKDMSHACVRHIGKGIVDIPDLNKVIKRSRDYVSIMEKSKQVYLPVSAKIKIMDDFQYRFGADTAAKVIDAANHEYNSGRSLFDVVNAITKTSQAQDTIRQTELETYATRLISI